MRRSSIGTEATRELRQEKVDFFEESLINVVLLFDEPDTSLRRGRDSRRLSGIGALFRLAPFVEIRGLLRAAVETFDKRKGIDWW